MVATRGQPHARRRAARHPRSVVSAGVVRRRASVSSSAPKGDLLPGNPTADSSRRVLFANQSEDATTKFQSALYRRYSKRYGALPTSTPEYRALVLRALRHGDMKWLESEIQKKKTGAWDFIFPPPKNNEARAQRETLEGWCRSPLSLIVRPREGFLDQSFLPGLSYEKRLKFVRAVLQSGISSPHFEGCYWSCPAIHAALAGDVPMLQELHKSGLDISSLRVEWAVFDQPAFTVVHAAALNGHTTALKWMATTYADKDWFDLPDAAGCTPLYYAVQTAQSVKSAKFLLTRGCNAFMWNEENSRSPLSVAIEVLPEVALEMLQNKTRPIDSWWGNPILSFDYEGIAVHGLSEGQLLFKSQSGDCVPIETLIRRSKRLELATVPIIKRLCERKWEAWAGSRHYQQLQAFLLLSIPYACEVVVGVDLGKELQFALFIFSLIGYVVYVSWQWLVLQSRGVARFLASGWDILAASIVVMCPFTALPHFCDALDIDLPFLGLGPELPPAAVTLDVVLLLAMCLRLTRYVSVFEEGQVGPYLNTVIKIVSSSWQPLLFLALVVAAFATGFLLLFRYGTSDGEPRITYPDMVILLMRWIFQPDDAFEAIAKIQLEAQAFALLIVFLVVGVLGSLRLVQDAVRSDTGAIPEREAQFQFFFMQIIDDIEPLVVFQSAEGKAELDDFYADLRGTGEVLQLETRAELWPQRSKERSERARRVSKSLAA